MRKAVKLIGFLLVFLSLFAAGSTGGLSLPTPEPKKTVKIVRSLYTDGRLEDFYTHGTRVSVFVPKVAGLDDEDLQAKINDNIRQYILARRNPAPDSTLWGDFEVSFYNGRLLGIHFAGTSYTKQAAHPNKIDVGLHIDLTTGEIYDFEDLFLPGADYLGRIREQGRQNGAYRLAANGYWNEWTEDQFKQAWTGESFLLTSDAVRVYGSLGAGGYLSGYRIPYADLMDSINVEGSLWTKLKGRAPAIVKVEPEELAAEDFRISELRLGDSAAAVIGKLGDPQARTENQDGFSYRYPNLEVGFDTGERVNNIVVNQWGVYTRRNVTPGMSLKLVKDRYGAKPTKTSVGGYDMYEYSYQPTQGQRSILLFAAKQGTSIVSLVGCRSEKQ